MVFGKKVKLDKAEFEHMLEMNRQAKENLEALTLALSRAQTACADLHKLIVRAEAAEKRLMRRGIH